MKIRLAFMVLILFRVNIGFGQPLCSKLFFSPVLIKSIQELSKNPIYLGEIFSREFVSDLEKALPRSRHESFSEIITLVSDPRRQAKLAKQYIGYNHVTKYWDDWGNNRYESSHLSEKTFFELDPFKEIILQQVNKVLTELKRVSGDESLKLNLVELRRARGMLTKGGLIESRPLIAQTPHLDSEIYEKFTYIVTLEASHDNATTIFFPDGPMGPRLQGEIHSAYVFDGSQLYHMPPTDSYNYRFYAIANIGH